MKEKDGTAF